MRQYAWYNPEFNVIVLQTIMEDCYIAFEWGPQDLIEVYDVLNQPEDDSLVSKLLWVPLGEL